MKIEERRDVLTAPLPNSSALPCVGGRGFLHTAQGGPVGTCGPALAQEGQVEATACLPPLAHGPMDLAAGGAGKGCPCAARRSKASCILQMLRGRM